MLKETTKYSEEGPMLFNVSELIIKIEKRPCSLVKEKNPLFVKGFHSNQENRCLH